MSNMFRKYGESLLDQPIGIEASRVRQAKEGKMRGTFQESARYRRIARREYRQGMRNKDYGAARNALDWLENKGEDLGSGIEIAGVRQGIAMNPPGARPNAPPPPLNTPDGLPTTPGGEAVGAALDKRLGLFTRMKDSFARGDNLKDYWDEAKGMGITAAGFGNGMERAGRDVRATIPRADAAIKYTPTSPLDPNATSVASNGRIDPSPNSNSLTERAGAQANRLGLFDRNNLVA